METETRGEKNRNPLNIRISPQTWLGKVTPSQDVDFEQFDSVEHGIRAGAKILLTYYSHGIDTINGIIERWAPSSENPTSAYAQNVSDWCGYDRDAHLMLTSLDDIKPVITAMIRQENGRCIYTDDVIASAIRMAFNSIKGQ